MKLPEAEADASEQMFLEGLFPSGQIGIPLSLATLDLQKVNSVKLSEER